MKTRVQYFIIFGLLVLVLAVAWYSFSTRGQASGPVFHAAVNRDCAPWDGAAFTISIPYDSISTIQVSIWRSPEIKRAAIFSFPDETGRIGNAVRLSQIGSPEQLTGTVLVRGVAQGMPIEGEFNLFTETGSKFKGKFVANWAGSIALCG
jgi:hypothetical protein